MHIEAKFTGPHKLLGYEPGKRYQLKIYKYNIVKRMDGTGRVPYESLTAFLKNWTDIKQI